MADGLVIYAKVRAFMTKATNSLPRPDNPKANVQYRRVSNGSDTDTYITTYTSVSSGMGDRFRAGIPS